MDMLLQGDWLLFEKLFIALLLGLSLGFERTIAGKMAGMRTYALMSMGSCLLIIVSQSVNLSYLGKTNFDPMHLAAAIMTGIGFIGGGLIIFTDNRLVGLTTAAGMWVAVAIGIAVGFDLYNIAIFATILTLITFTLFFKVESEIRKLSEEGSRD
jgi:putative Mg2+ transporter-C (MgtC) family protein